MNRWLGLSAIIEAATGLALMIDPPVVTQLLLGADVSGVAIALGQMVGLGLLSLGLACWLGRNGADNFVAAFWAMLTYNLIVALYLLYLGISGEWVGRLLWPAVALHTVVTVLLARAWFGERLARPSLTDETL
jgi:hypothetical protein